ncbi:hypothetical protein [Lysinibacillus sp. ZYM-1]|uniref:hypothetical protein n=1 Tax=Lysinibacillus sp. ZYM-1 TaxID=1681184 RepID=UPI0006CE63F1|nr:hypothetical protein [Lysinibacillus sp. ZYM-1]KPN96109.1 hypothetical protein AO843_18655 [Lysinibacillus sp. ZYM-1]
MNESGYSFVETILAFGILMLLCSSLLPITYTMKTNLTNKKLEMIAAETAYEGLKLFQAVQQSEGTRTIEQVDYQWVFNGQGICVRFHNAHEPRQKCLQFTGGVYE